MRRVFVAGILAAVAATALPGRGQQQQDCDLEVLRTPGSRGEMVTLPEGEVRIDQWGGVEAVCGDRRLMADSASYYQKAGVLYLHGNMVYTDGERRLESERGTYYEQQALFRAEGNVRLTDNGGRSTLTGPVLDYFPATLLRPAERMFASGRPHLMFYPEDPGTGSLPFDIDADRLHIYGNSMLAGAGNVVAVRADLTATGDSLDLRGDQLLLIGEPVVTAGQMVLEGDTILALMEDQQIREILAWPNGTAVGSDLSLEAPSLRLFVADDEIERVIASAGDPERTGVVDTMPREPWARGESQDYTLVADSMDIQRPGGRLDRVIAINRARAVSSEERVPGGGLLYRDWLEGDTITAFFTVAEPAVGEVAPVGEPQLTRLEALGGVNQARTLYYLEGQLGSDGETGEPSPNYIIGRQVTLVLESGEVIEARVVGPALGVYLEPIPVSTNDSLPRDTLAVDTLPRTVIEALEDSASVPRDTTDTTSVGGPSR